jgi:hypothetical protein
MGVYIEMLLCILTDADYRQKYSDAIDNALHTGGAALRRSEQERIQEHRSAARTVENLICTSRESLLGSSVWKGEFFHELTTRPFYNVSFCDSLSHHDHTCSRGIADDRGKERGLERCDACGRENKSSGGYKVRGGGAEAGGGWLELT